MLGAERRRRKEGRKRCPVPGKATKQKMNQAEGGQPGRAVGASQQKLLSGSRAVPPHPDQASTRPLNLAFSQVELKSQNELG